MTTGRKPTPTPTDLPVPALIELIRAAIGELRGAWPWLADLAQPGPTLPPSERWLSPEQRIVEDAQIRRDRIHATRQGPTGGAGPHVDAARPGPLAARSSAVRQIIALTTQLYAAHHGNDLTWPVTDPAQRTPTLRCWYCAGEGSTIGLPDAAHPSPPGSSLALVPCPQCTCPACHGRGPCPCSLDDAIMRVGLDVLAAELANLSDQPLALDVLASLERIDRGIRRAAGADAADLVIKAPCPACGRRELVVSCSSPNESEWAVRCASKLCRCTGPGCRCGRPVRYKGRVHLWPAAEWHGRTGLAARLGVDLAALGRGEVRAPLRRGLASGRAGTGGRS